MSKIAYQYEYQIDVKDIEFTPHKRSAVWGSSYEKRSGALTINQTNMTKQEQYEALLPQIQAVMDKNVDIIANMANMAAMLHETFGFWWTGFYRVINNELVLGPFQGPLACTRIAYGRGVCGSAWKERRTLVVPDVEEFPGHIACSSASRSEIVVPVFHNNEVIAVLDIDSDRLATFDETDAKYLERIVMLLIIP